MESYKVGDRVEYVCGPFGTVLEVYSDSVQVSIAAKDKDGNVDWSKNRGKQKIMNFLITSKLSQ